MSVVHFPSLKPLTIKNIINHCKNTSLNGEMGGSVQTSGFIDECWGKMAVNRKIYVDLNDLRKIHGYKKNLVTWHMHPHCGAWWPSSENLTSTTDSFDLPGLLFTKYGTWIYYKTNVFKKNVRGIANAIKTMQKNIFKDNLMFLKNVKDTYKAQSVIQMFVNSMAKIGITVVFLWDHKRLHQQICNFIKTIPSLKNFGPKPLNLNNILLEFKKNLKKTSIRKK